MVYRIYAGIGSRQTPDKYCELFTNIGYDLANKDFILRSGGAEGADKAFENGCDFADGMKEIFIPWKGFNRSDSKLYPPSDEAMKLAESFHPAWNNCTPAAKLLHARNGHQILGKDLKSPVDFVLCYSPGGFKSGGTSQALRIAKKYNIPIHNFYDMGEDWEKTVESLLY